MKFMFTFCSLLATIVQRLDAPPIIAESESIRSAYPIGSLNVGIREMMRLKVTPLGEGLHPSETFVSVQTRDGTQDLVVNPSSIHSSTVAVGWPVGREGTYLLVELPVPTSLGSQRVWVSKDELIPEKRMRLAK